MNLLAPDHRTSRAAFQSLAHLAAGRVSRLNKDIFLLIRPSVVCPPRRRCTCSSQRLMYVLPSSSIHSVSQLSLTVFLFPLMTPTTPPPPPLFFPSLLLIIGCGSTDGAGKSTGISSLIYHSQSLAHVLPQLLHRQSDCAPPLSLLRSCFSPICIPNLCNCCCMYMR